MIDLSNYPDALVLEPRDPLDKAIIGLGARCGQDEVLIYDRDKLVAAFMELNDWDQETADEWIGFNVDGAWVGDGTPMIMEPLDGEQVLRQHLDAQALR